MRGISRKAESFTESVIREMNRLAVAAEAVSLAQGFPDFSCPPELKAGAAEAVAADHNQYAITFGAKPLRDAIAAKTARWHPDWVVDADTQVTVVNGATEGMIAAMLGLLDPGDEVIIFEPFYENYGPDAILSGAIPRYVTLHEPDWSIDPDELRAAVTPRTRAIVVNSPHNPTGKVFTPDELRLVAELCRQHDVYAVTDEVYEHLVFPDATSPHVPLAGLPGMRDRTLRMKTRLQIGGTSIPVVSKSTVTAMFGNFSFLKSLICCNGSYDFPVIFSIALSPGSIPISLNSSLNIPTRTSACASDAANTNVFSSPSGSSL